jgi:ABC-2 type transport system ATP-binding protein
MKSGRDALPRVQADRQVGPTEVIFMFDIEVENLTKRFGDFTAVDALNFSVEHGEVFGLLGPNGAGKSTLIRMLTTLVPPTSGAARVNGFDIARNANGVRQSIGVIPQAMTSDLDLSATENMSIFAKLYGIPREKRRRAIQALLAAVELTQWADKPVKMLSGGMRRRLEIARGLVHEPKIFFLDEPTTGLDPVSRVAVWEMLARLKRERDLTILVTTHYMDEADKLCDRIAIIDHGKLAALDSPLKLKASIPGQNILEVSFANVPQNWAETLSQLPEVAEVKAEDHVFRISSNNGPRTTVELLDAARKENVAITALSVQSTTLDDVFVHYTGHQLRDSLQAPSAAESPYLMRRG